MCACMKSLATSYGGRPSSMILTAVLFLSAGRCLDNGHAKAGKPAELVSKLFDQHRQSSVLKLQGSSQCFNWRNRSVALL